MLTVTDIFNAAKNGKTITCVVGCQKVSIDLEKPGSMQAVGEVEYLYRDISVYNPYVIDNKVHFTALPQNLDSLFSFEFDSDYEIEGIYKNKQEAEKEFKALDEAKAVISKISSM